ncbi:hypothetical protein [Alteromonas lipolytica]|uniref:Solute-binding protein family 3/N-terminal domain-containing protein n=2 Tax=Alteromonas lipolytica TaxID=1856405 RepID=A0A1E8FKU8_9ALTE|nr:hypothetical protein [Alteromonas lipolytica]OFI36248.1 hypothetical protein BFC17_09000 [Alteromonas lipolytica]GGF79100.1 hypothetical protein GCM10011338_34320 [Alteromonas lipolytica]
MTQRRIINQTLTFWLCSWLFVSVKSLAESESFSQIKFITHSPYLLEVINKQEAPESSMNAAYLALFKQMNFFPRAELTVTSRFETILQGKEPVCTFLMIKNPAREALYRFSLPTDFLLAHRLYQTTNTPAIPAELLNPGGELASLQALFNTFPQRKLMLLKDRSYGSFLDGEIAALPESAKYYRWGSHQFDSDIKMLVKGRGEYILAYPYDIKRESPKYPGVTFQSNAIAGNSAIRTGHIMCNDTPASERFIQRVNRELRQLYFSADFLDAHLRFNDPSAHEALKQGLKVLQAL